MTTVGPALHLDDAIQFLEEVKSEFKDTPHTYAEFLDIMQNCKRNRIEEDEAILRLTNLFQGNNKLLVGFEKFLPSGVNMLQEGSVNVNNVTSNTSTNGTVKSAKVCGKRKISPHHRYIDEDKSSKDIQDTDCSKNVNQQQLRIHDDKYHEYMHCPLCDDKYSSSKSACPVNENDPIQSRECIHTICYGCFQMMHVAAIQRTGPHRVWMDCPFCRAKQAFHGKRPVIARSVCLLVGAAVKAD